jgi:ricin-type beta-trefoil lectin protein
MRNNKRIAVAAAAGSLLVAGMVTALTLTSGTARADEVTQCEVFPNAGGQCNLSTTVTAPPDFGGLQLQITSNPSAYHANVTWSDDCTSASGQTVAESGTGGGTAPTIVTLTVGVSNPVSCDVTANVQMDINKTFVNGFMYLDTEPGSSNPAPTPTATSSAPTGGPVGVIKGYDDKCVDDAGNSSAIRSKVIIWTCSSSDKAQKWEYAAGELVHNGLCLDDKGNGGSGSKIILWTCNESSGEQWNHVLNNTFQVKAHSFTQCLDDPAYSKKNGTQLAIYACHNSSNQHWTVP